MHSTDVRGNARSACGLHAERGREESRAVEILSYSAFWQLKTFLDINFSFGSRRSAAELHKAFPLRIASPFVGIRFLLALEGASLSGPPTSTRNEISGEEVK